MHMYILAAGECQQVELERKLFPFNALNPSPNLVVSSHPMPHAQLPLSSFKFLTRLHYCAADTRTWGPNAEWGEHEMDYILFIK